MNAAPTYAFPIRALRRWRDERLTIADDVHGALRATFLFEGTTCGSIPFALTYVVRLSAAEDGYRVIELGCDPVPGDEGHRRMCAYLENPTRLLDALKTEQSVLGLSLAEAIAWQPATSPAGCLCAESARNHKWLAVLHTIHFALAQRALTTPAS